MLWLSVLTESLDEKEDVSGTAAGQPRHSIQILLRDAHGCKR